MKQNKKKFKLFDMNRDGKGVEPEETGPLNLKNFFKLFSRKFSKMLSLNFYFIPLFLLLMAAFLLFLWGPKLQTPASKMFPAIYGVMNGGAPSPVFSVIWGACGLTVSTPVLTVPILIGYLAIALLLLSSFGMLNVGTTYILRGLLRGDPVFMWSDFWYAVKRNFRQGLFLGIFDALAISALIFNFIYYNSIVGIPLFDVMLFVTVFIGAIWFFMRFYMYLILITFDLPNKKILKNSLIFALLGIKRNLMALLGIMLLAVINILLIILLVPYGIIVPILLPFVYFLACSSFISAYAAYPKIKQHMIDPYYTSDQPDAELIE